MSAENNSGRRVALVTGGAKGIGASIARRFAADGVAVVVADVDTEQAAATTAGIDARGGTADWIATDVSDSDQVRSAVEHTVSHFGGLDIIVNNAATTIPAPAIDTTTEDEWDRVLSVNLRSVFLTARHGVPHLRSRSASNIVNIASIDGLVAEAGIAAYCASKGGIVNLTRAMALDLAPDGIRVNCVCPGMTDTPLFRHFMGLTDDPEAILADRLRRVPLGRLVEADEVADVVRFLASPAASAVTGASLAVDLGLGAGWDYTG